MAGYDRRAAEKGDRSGQGEGPAERDAEVAGEDSCRCKEVSKKTLPEMLKLMLGDLAFWKKAKNSKVR